MAEKSDLVKLHTPVRGSIRRLSSPRVSITVTQEVINQATKADSSHCMIAEAIRTNVPGAKSISVDLQTIRWTDPTRQLRYAYLTPRSAQLALIRFDQGELPQPFNIFLERAHVTRSQLGVPRESTVRKPEHKEEVKQRKGPPTRLGPATIRGSRLSREIVGGSPPPLGPLAVASSTAMSVGRKEGERSIAKRRAFGLKGLRP